MKPGPEATRNTSSRGLKQLIIRSASELGFDKIGFARAGPLEEPAKRLDQWLGEGFQAGMKWMETRSTERKNILEYFPAARTVVSLARNYYTGTSEAYINVPENKVKISNYAWGDDYHRTIKDKLQRLKEIIRKEYSDVTVLTCVDTSPVMEKAWAERAGLGWIGKHTNLITRDYGSWLFLAELILDIELEPDGPFPMDLCGTCTACIDSCPTQALSAYRLDANKCISYLTIEHRGELPTDLASRFEGWIYGCDICQEVCPWNKTFARPSGDPSFLPRESLCRLTAREWQELEPSQFTVFFKNSAIKRTKFAGLKRNIQAVLPRREDPE